MPGDILKPTYILISLEPLSECFGTIHVQLSGYRNIIRCMVGSL